jgi:hypothetical protein
VEQRGRRSAFIEGRQTSVDLDERARTASTLLGSIDIAGGERAAKNAERLRAEGRVGSDAGVAARDSRMV